LETIVVLDKESTNGKVSRTEASFDSGQLAASGVLASDRPFISLAGSLLGSDLDTDCHAVDAGCRVADFRAAFHGDGDSERLLGQQPLPTSAEVSGRSALLFS